MKLKFNKKWQSFALNIFLAFFWLLFLNAHLEAFFLYHKTATALLALAECLTVIFILTRHSPQAVSNDPVDWGVAFAGSWLSLWFRPTGAPEIPLGTILIIIGFCFQIAAGLSLNRSFGIVPTDRGVQTKGMYKFVRHPVYASYFFGFAGYLINNPSYFNASVLIIIVGLLFWRINREEKFLLRVSLDYQTYAKKTPWRILPFVY